MFDSCQTKDGSNSGPNCSDVAEKIVQLFGWRQTYKVEKLQRNIPARATTKISVIRPVSEYPKLSKEGPESWVVVHNLQSQGGGILDPDDRLSDVADDREQIMASFEDCDGAHHHGGGDGASGSSSVGTGSPDIFHDGEHKYGPGYPRTDIEVTGEQIASGSAGVLQVRRGSEPALNRLPVGPPAPANSAKRWSAAPLIVEPPGSAGGGGYQLKDDHAKEEDEEDEDEDEGYSFGRIGRDGSNRLSMQFLGDGAGYRWAEAAERALTSRLNSPGSTSLPRENKRREPLGQANSSTSPHPSDEHGELIVIRNEPGQLGIHVVPDYDRFGKDRGLLVQGIEPDGRIDRDGRISIYDRIVEINGQSVINMSFQRVQELFTASLNSSELRLRVVRSPLDGLRKPPPPVYPKFPDDKENVSMVECEQKHSTSTKVATVSPTKKIPAVSRNLKSLITNNRRIGKKIEIDLMKGNYGLGFSITTRDNPAGGNCPIYIKNIMAKGAAVEDGRLKIGDRLLEVNGIEMTGKTQTEAVTILRNAPVGSRVRIIVSRQEEVNSKQFDLPRVLDVDMEREEEQNETERYVNDVPPNIPPLPQNHIQSKTPDKGSAVSRIISQFQEASNLYEKSEDSMIFPWKHREILNFDIPVHDSEKAGLGISVKGKTSGSQDLGIFIKNIINGGAASRDKRLRNNDQLLNVNGVSLLQRSNGEAMEILRKAMLHTESPIPGSISLTIARRASSPAPTRNSSRRNSSNGLLNSSSNGSLGELTSSPNDTEVNASNQDHSGGSTNTVIFKGGGNVSNDLINTTKHLLNDSYSNMITWNPVVDRLTGQNGRQLRNESYYIATHETLSASMIGNGIKHDGKLISPTVNVTSGDTILIEDECGPRVLPQPNKLVNHISNGSSDHLESRSDHEPDGKASLSGSNYDKSTESSSQTVCLNNDVTYSSQLSLENPNAKGFSRDAFGRQSMSEKRHATLDAKNTDTYQRTKKMREERNKLKVKENADKLGQLGPSLGMKKSSSLESLQTMVQEIQMQEDGNPAYTYRGGSGALKVIRGRGCDESLRAAVVDPNHRSETNAKKHWLLDPPSDFEKEVDGFSNVRGGPRQSSLNAALDVKNKASAKKKSGLFKGIGSMFRFGKHRKMDFQQPEPVQLYQPTGEFDTAESGVPQQQQQQLDNASIGNSSTHSQSSQQKIAGGRSDQEQLPGVHGQHIERESMHPKHGFTQRHAEQIQVIPEGAIPPMRYRNHVVENHYVRGGSERSQLMKAYEQRQQQRYHAYAAAMERDNETDRTRQIEQSNSTYTEYGRPGSRSGISEPVRYTHYVNYNDLQNHLSRKQHQYHSQRQVRHDNNNQLRPVSNFYEYESVQSILNAQNNHHHRPLHQNNNHRVPPYVEHNGVNSSAARHHPMQARHHPASNMLYQQQQHQRGPFVTHVTIGDHHHLSQQSGSRV